MPMQKNWSRRNLTPAQATLALDEWLIRARIEQLPPRSRWHGWLLIGGRGSGKTRAGAEWVNALARGLPMFGDGMPGRLALVGETLADVRDVMVEGPSGILAAARRGFQPRFEVTRRRLVWPNGATAMMFSSEDPDSLRGPQFGAAWCDELAKWRHDEACFDMLQFGLRLGSWPRQLVTTTPKPTALIRRLIADPGFVVTRMKTSDNAQNLAAGFMAAIEERYAGTRLGRQELDGELLADSEGALWTRGLIRTQAPPGRLARVVIGVDPPVTSKRGSDACGIVAAGMDAGGGYWVLADESFAPAPPARWASRVAALHDRLGADAIVVETNQGGDLVTGVLRSIDRLLPVKAVTARAGKLARAEPVAALYEQGRVRHAMPFPALEDEMCQFGAAGLPGGRSPDRLDALVWAMTELAGAPRALPRARPIG